MNGPVTLAGVQYEVTPAQVSDEDRESLEFRKPGDMLGFEFEIAQYGDWGSSDVRVICRAEVPAAVLSEALDRALVHFGVRGTAAKAS